MTMAMYSQVASFRLSVTEGGLLWSDRDKNC